MTESIQSLLRQLGRTARQARLARLGLRWLAQALAIGLVCCWLDNVLRLPLAARMLLLAAGIIWLGFVLWQHGVRAHVWRVRPERTARELEIRCGIGDNLLINACQFEAAPPAGLAGQFARQAVRAAQTRAQLLTAATLTEPRRLRRVGGLAAICIVVWAGYMLAFPRYAGNACLRFIRPLADVPPVGTYDVRLTPCGRVTVAEGDAVAFRADVRDAQQQAAVQLVAPPTLRQSHGREGVSAIERPMLATGDGGWRLTVENVQESFTVRALAGDSWSPSTLVEVRRRPRVTAALFRVTPPAYTGLPAVENPGPPASLSAPEGSRVELRVTLDRDVDGLLWQTGTNRVACAGRRRDWRLETGVGAGGDYRLLELGELRDGQDVARGALTVVADRPPEVELVTDDRNRLVWPGVTLELPVTATDDYGVREITVTARQTSRESTVPRMVGHWAYQGPPGRKDVRERLTFTVDPLAFEGGETYAIEAQARDFSPRGVVGRSTPVVLRIHRPQDAVAGNVAGQQVLDALQRAIDAQRRALGLTRNLQMNLDEALQTGHLDRHRQSIVDQQTTARTHGREALRGMEESKSTAAPRLSVLLEREMSWVLDDAAHLSGRDVPALTKRVAAIGDRQTYILTELLSLLGRMASALHAQTEQAATGTPPPTATAQEEARDLHDLLQDFSHVQKKILEESKALLEKRPEDLTDEEKSILGQLAREEQKWANELKDKLNDLTKTPVQDFADGSLSSQLNEVWQDVSKAAAELYAKKLDLAVPQEQSGLENAKSLEQNLERWLSDKPDNLKWSMEEPPTTPDAPLAELPKELEDIVGDLLDKEEQMTEDVEDITSSWIDSMDKGVGWDASDGPISDMSAKGVTGNMLPNQDEIAGRSGEGRTGRSDGQMAQNTAEGKDGRQTPTRLTATPFEPGSVDDKSKADPGGATGGGKLSGFAGQGLRGKAPPPRLDQMQRLAGKQSEIRQAAEKLSLGLRSHAMPSGDLEESILRMREVETLARAGRGAEIRRAFGEALGSMREARDALRTDAVVQREQGGLSRQDAAALWTGLQDAIPAGYEDLVSAYYRRLAEGPSANETPAAK